MDMKRSFGISETSTDIPYNLERYDNESKSEFTEIGSRLSSVITESIGLPENCPARSRIWQFHKDPWQFYSDSGKLLFVLERIKYSAIKIEVGEGDYRCNTFLRFDWTGHDHIGNIWSNLEIPMVATSKDMAGDEIVQWDMGKLYARNDWVMRPVSFMQEIDPHYYDEIAAIEWCLFVGRGKLYDC